MRGKQPKNANANLSHWGGYPAPGRDILGQVLKPAVKTFIDFSNFFLFRFPR